MTSAVFTVPALASVAPPPPSDAVSIDDGTASTSFPTSSGASVTIETTSSLAPSSSVVVVSEQSSFDTSSAAAAASSPSSILSSSARKTSEYTEPSSTSSHLTTAPAQYPPSSSPSATPVGSSAASPPAGTNAPTFPNAPAAMLRKDIIIISTVFAVLFVGLVLLGLWLVKRRKEKKLADDVAATAEWIDPSNIGGMNLRPITPAASDSPSTITGIEVHPPWSPITSAPVHRPPFVIKRPRRAMSFPPSEGLQDQDDSSPSPSVRRVMRKADATVAMPAHPGKRPSRPSAGLSTSSGPPSPSPSEAATVIVTRRQRDQEIEEEGDVPAATHARSNSLGSMMGRSRLCRVVRRREGVEDLRGDSTTEQ